MGRYRLSISTRITLASTLAFLTVVAAITWMVLAGISVYLDREARTAMLATRDSLVALQGELRSDPHETLAEFPVPPQQQIGIYTPDGSQVAVRNAIVNLPPPTVNGFGQERRVPRRADQDDYQGYADETTRVVTFTDTIGPGSRAVWTVRIVRDMALNDRFLQVLRIVFVAADTLGIAIVWAVSWVLGRRILVPVNRLIDGARAISADDLHTRVPETGPDDELRRLAGAFNEMLDRLSRSFERQSRFVSDASHELKTPLAALNGHVSMLIRWGRNDPEVLGESLAIIKTETERMRRLVDRLLFLARSDSDGAAWTPQAVDVAALLEEVASEARPRAPDRAIRVDCADPIGVTADHTLLRQAVGNLVDNAIRYSRTGGDIAVRAEAGDDGVTISVIDAGPALSEEVLARVFDRFYRADDSRSRLTEGTGLGLSICQAIVTRHGGTISAGTVGGVSNRFAIHLPDTPPPDTP